MLADQFCSQESAKTCDNINNYIIYNTVFQPCLAIYHETLRVLLVLIIMNLNKTIEADIFHQNPGTKMIKPIHV